MKRQECDVEGENQEDKQDTVFELLDSEKFLDLLHNRKIA